MTLLPRLLLLSLLLSVLACTPAPEADPVAPSTPAPEDRRYNPAELAGVSAANREGNNV